MGREEKRRERESTEEREQKRESRDPRKHDARRWMPHCSSLFLIVCLPVSDRTCDMKGVVLTVAVCLRGA